MRLYQVLTWVFLYTSSTQAWPWPPTIHDIEGLIMRRQNNNAPSSSSPASTDTASPSNTQPANSPTPTATFSIPATGTDTGSITGSTQPTDSSSPTNNKSQNSASQTQTATGKQSGSARTTSRPKTTAIDPRLPAGGIQMISPAITDPASYYKVGDQVTFAWNYTSLVVTPTAIDILVKCSANAATYTLARNTSVKETGAAVWDTAKDSNGKDPLLTAKYTLVIHDADQEVTAVPSAGHLGSYSQFTFGMYLKQEYTPLGDFVCATCSGALSDMDRQTFKFLFAMGLITVLSFTWFAGGFALF